MIDLLKSQKISAGPTDTITLDVACVETIGDVRYGAILDLDDNFRHVVQLSPNSTWLYFDGQVSLEREALKSVPSYAERLRGEEHYGY